MTSISTNFAPNATPAFQKNTTQPTVEPKSTKKTGMSTAAKVGIGAVAIATAAIATIAIKNKSAAKALMKEAKNLGFENVETYKTAKTFFNDIKKCDKFSYEDVAEITKKLSKEGKIVSGDKMALFSPAQTKEALAKEGKAEIIPENAFSITYLRGGKQIHSELINPKQITDDLLDFVDDAWKNGNISVKSLKIEK